MYNFKRHKESSSHFKSKGKYKKSDETVKVGFMTNRFTVTHMLRSTETFENLVKEGVLFVV